MADSPLYVAPKQFAWDFSGMFNDVTQRGQIALQHASSSASSMTSSKSGSDGFERKGLADWWAGDHQAEQVARAGMMNLLKEYQNDTSGAMSDPRFAEYMGSINQARSYPVNEFRGQQKERMDKWVDKNKDRADELVVSDGKLVAGGKGVPMTVEDYTRAGISAAGQALSWEGSVTDSKGFVEGIDKMFGSLKSNSNDQTSISGQDVPEDVANGMSTFKERAYGQKDNSEQLNDAVAELINSFGETRTNDIRAWYRKSLDYKNKSQKKISEGGFLNNSDGTLDMSAVDQAIYGVQNISKNGKVVGQEVVGWLPDRIVEMAKKHQWVNVEGKNKFISKNAKDAIGSGDFIRMMAGDWEAQGTTVQSFFFQNPSQRTLKQYSDDKSAFINRDLDRTNAINKKAGFTEDEPLQPGSEVLGGGVGMIPGVFVDMNGKLVNGIPQSHPDMPEVYITAPSSQLRIAADPTKIPDGSIDEKSRVPRALYHTLGKGGMAVFDKDELLAVKDLVIALPKSKIVELENIKKPAPGVVDAVFPFLNGLSDTLLKTQGVTKKPVASGKHKVERQDEREFKNYTLEEILDDDDLRKIYNEFYHEDLRTITRAQLRSSGMNAPGVGEDSDEFVAFKNYDSKVTPASNKTFEITPKTREAQSLLEYYKGDPSGPLNAFMPQADEESLNIIEQSTVR